MQHKFIKVLQKLVQVTSEAERFLIDQPDVYEDIKQMLQQFYRYILEDNSIIKRVLPELFIDGMDKEQIWQQMELCNKFITPKFIILTSKMLILEPEQLKVRLEVDTKGNFLVKHASDKIEISTINTIDTGILKNKKEYNKHYNSETVVFKNKLKFECNMQNNSNVLGDDKFFKLNEMEKFLKVEEKKVVYRKQRKLLDNDSIDYFADNLGCENSESDACVDRVAYNDFFCSDCGESSENYNENKEQKIHDYINETLNQISAKEESHEFQASCNSDKNFELRSKQAAHISTEMDEMQMSSYELHLMSLKRIREDYEEEMLGEKRWTLKGEVQAKSRPKNSVLEEFLDFESTIRPAPLITERTTQSMERIIQKRIKDKSWDDVERKERPINVPIQYEKELILQQKKSKESLVTIYESEYQKQLQNLHKNQNAETEVREEHQEIKNLMNDLFIKLNAIANFNISAKPVAPEPRIISNTPAIYMEEVAPVGLSDVKLLAPMEVFKGPQGELVGKSELNNSTKKHALRLKKSRESSVNKALKASVLLKRRYDAIAPNTKLKPKRKLTLSGCDIVQKINTTQDVRFVKSSKLFFTKLQNERNGFNAKLKAAEEIDLKSAKRLKL